jgi:hypothetical protein
MYFRILCIQKPENERAVPAGYIFSGSRYTRPERRVQFPVFKYRRSVNVYTLFSYKVVPERMERYFRVLSIPEYKYPQPRTMGVAPSRNKHAHTVLRPRPADETRSRMTPGSPSGSAGTQINTLWAPLGRRPGRGSGGSNGPPDALAPIPSRTSAK